MTYGRVQVHLFDINRIYFPILYCCDGDHPLNGFNGHYWCEDLCVVNALTLGEASCHEPGFEFCWYEVCISLDLEDPTCVNGVCTLWKVGDLPCAHCLQSIQFLSHSLLPMFPILSNQCFTHSWIQVLSPFQACRHESKEFIVNLGFGDWFMFHHLCCSST